MTGTGPGTDDTTRAGATADVPHDYVPCDDEIRQARDVLRELRRARRRDYVRRLDYTLGEEIANAITHGLGWVFGIVALVLLLVRTVPTQDAPRIVSALVYGVSLILLYTSSTLYHSLIVPKARHVFKIIDHSAIYLLIAGSYTPFAVVLLRGRSGWALLAVEWAIAVVGIAVEAFWAYRPRWVSGVVYIAMGWLAMLVIRPIAAVMDPAGVALLVAGGVSYTLGVAFYVAKKVPYMHAVFHVFVLAGSVCHFLAILLHVLG